MTTPMPFILTSFSLSFWPLLLFFRKFLLNYSLDQLTESVDLSPEQLQQMSFFNSEHQKGLNVIALVAEIVICE